MSKPTKDPCLTRWALLVQEYEIELHYLPGKENILADVLSRLTATKEDAANIPKELEDSLIDRINHTEEINSFIPEKVPWKENELRKNQKVDKKCQEILKTIKKNAAGGKRQLKFKVINGILFAHLSFEKPKQPKQKSSECTG